MKVIKLIPTFAVTAILSIILAATTQSCDKTENEPDNHKPGTTEVTSVTISETSIELEVGANKTLTATVSPNNATFKNITWTSSNQNVATVSAGGVVTAVKAGTATITATSDKAKAECKVTVKEATQQLQEIDVKMEGAINHTTYTKDQTATVTFNRFPASVEEFKKVREKIGGEPHGALALQLMAFEMYRRNNTIGEECIKLNNTSSNVKNVTGRLKELFGKDTYYARPYQVAAFLKGATPKNGYNPTEPYTVQVRVSPSLAYQNSSIFQSTILFLNIKKGDDEYSGNLYVLQTKKPGEPGKNGKFFIVNNSSALHSQVQEKSFDVEWKGLK